MRALVPLLVVVALGGCGGIAGPSLSSVPEKAADGGSDPLAELKKLLDTIPRDSHPRADKDGEIERNKANQWLQKNVIGKPLALSGPVSKVRVTPMGDAYEVDVVIGEPGKTPEGEVLPDMPGRLPYGDIGTVIVGETTWHVRLGSFRWEKLDEATAKQLRDLKGKRATFRGVVAKEAEYIWAVPQPTGFMIDPLMPQLGIPPRRPILFIALNDVSVDGIDTLKKK